MGLRHLLGVDQDDAPPARRAEPTRSIGSGDILETASSGPLLVEVALRLGSLGVLCVAGDALERRVLVVEVPTCWRLRPVAPGAGLPGDMCRAAGGVLAGGRVLEVFADDARVVAVIAGDGASGSELTLSCSLSESPGEPVIWLPDGVAPAGIDDAYLALDAGVANELPPPDLSSALRARERPIT